MTNFKMYDEVIINIPEDDIRNEFEEMYDNQTGWIVSFILANWYAVLLDTGELIYIDPICIEKTEGQRELSIAFYDEHMFKYSEQALDSAYNDLTDEEIERYSMTTKHKSHKQEEVVSDEDLVIEGYKYRMLQIRALIELAIDHNQKERFDELVKEYKFLKREANKEVINHVKDNYMEEVRCRLER